MALRAITGALFLLVLTCFWQVRAFGLDPIAVLTPSDVPPGFSNNFGAAVAVSGDYIAVGAPEDPWYNGDAKGAIYVFRRLGPTWIEVAKITAQDGVYLDQLGYSVAMDGDVIVAGAPHIDPGFFDNGGPGAAYVFRRDENGTPENPWDDTWPQEAKLTVDREPTWALLGYSVGISGSVIVVGRPYAYGYLGSGEVFRYECDHWNHEASLFGSEPQEGTVGWTVDIDGSRVVLGADQYDDYRGAAYVFAHEGSEWVQETKLMASDRMPGDGFGGSVSISGGTVVAGAQGVDGSGPNSTTGAAYVFGLCPDQSWLQTSRLTAPNVVDLFGLTLSCDKGLCLIGRLASGEWWAYLFRWAEGQWAEVARLPGRQQPVAISMSGQFAVVHTSVYPVRDRRDLSSLANFQSCFGMIGNTPTCNYMKSAGEDGAIDLRSFEKFMGGFAGPQP